MEAKKLRDEKISGSKKKTTGSSEKSVKKSNSRASADRKAKVIYKIYVRKLPIRGFGASEFEASTAALSSAISNSLPKHFQGENLVEVEHFIEGKISRKRGPLSAAGFLSVRSPVVLARLFQLFPHSLPFLDDASMLPPDLTTSPYQKCLKKKEVVDKLEGTYESDQEFSSFLLQDQISKAKLPSAEQQLDQMKSAHNQYNMKENALIKFLKLKNQKRASQEKLSKKSSKDKGVSGDDPSPTTAKLKKSIHSSSSTRTPLPSAMTSIEDAADVDEDSLSTTKKKSQPRGSKSSKVARQSLGTPIPSTAVSGAIKRTIERPKQEKASIDSNTETTPKEAPRPRIQIIRRDQS